MLMRKSYACLGYFYAKVAINIDKANSKIFQFNFASLSFFVAGKLFCTRVIFVRHIIAEEL